MISLSLFAFTIAVLSLLGGLFEINPVWLYGPYEPFSVFAPAQPDWYMGWLEGLMRMWPPIEFTVLGVTFASTFLPGVVIPGIMFTLVFAYPWIEARLITKDTAEHHLLQRVRDVPERAGLGFGSLVFLLIVFVAGSNDIIAANTTTSLQTITNLLRGAAIVLPPLVGFAAYRAAQRLQESRRPDGVPAPTAEP
jgi:ubiquinol-cytochrome c reductase cytochrome b subunit